MSNNTHSSLKNGSGQHTPDDTIYLKPVRLACHICNHSGQPKIRKNLWQLHTHYLYHHRTEPFQAVESMILKLIKEGCLR